MAGKLRIRVSFSFTKGSDTVYEKEWQYEDAFDDTALNTPVIERLELGASQNLPATLPGGIYVAQNLDSTDSCEIYANTAEDPFAQLLAGDVCIFRVDPDAASDVVKSGGTPEYKHWCFPPPS